MRRAIVAAIVGFTLATAALYAHRRARVTELPRPRSPWAAVGVGSSFESTTHTHLLRPAPRDSVTRIRQTLIARVGREAVLSVEIETDGIAQAPQQLRVPLDDPAEATACAVPPRLVQEPCEVPAGRFTCTRRSLAGEGSRAAETWSARGVPVPVRAVLRGGDLVATTELTAMHVVKD